MQRYYYKAKELSGQVHAGELDAPSQTAAVDILQKQNLFVVSVSDKPLEGVVAKERKKEEIKVALKKDIFLFARVTAEDKMLFSIQLANMVGAGVTLIKSLKIILEQVKNPKFQMIIKKVYNDIETGMSFSDALQKHRKVFPDYFTSSVKAGEISGSLDEVLNRVSEFAEHDMEVRQSIQVAMTYPMILITVGIGIIITIMTTVIPSFVSTFVRVGITLPRPTQIMYNLSTFLREDWYLALLGLVAFVIVFRASSATVIGRYWIDRIKLNIPFLGPMVERFALSRFARTLGMLLNCGVPILLAFKISKDNVDNMVYKKGLDIVYDMVKGGKKVHEALKAAKVFPGDLVQITSVGEETGKLSSLLTKIGDYYDKTAKYAVKKFMAMLEPVFLIVIGSFIAFIMASLLLPIFDMMKLLRQAQGG